MVWIGWRWAEALEKISQGSDNFEELFLHMNTHTHTKKKYTHLLLTTLCPAFINFHHEFFIDVYLFVCLFVCCFTHLLGN